MRSLLWPRTSLRQLLTSDSDPRVEIIQPSDTSSFRCRVPSLRSNRDIAEICTSHLRLDVLLHFDTFFDGAASQALSWISSADGFMSTIAAPSLLFNGAFRRSKMSIINIQRLTHWGTATSTTKSDWLVLCKVFQVEKSSGGDRLIMDATPVNRASFKAPQMYLPSLHDILTRFSKRKYFASVDAFSYFYQFPLCEEVSRYLTLGNKRSSTNVLLLVRKGFRGSIPQVFSTLFISSGIRCVG